MDVFLEYGWFFSAILYFTQIAGAHSSTSTSATTSSTEAAKDSSTNSSINLSADEIVSRADEIRAPLGSFQMEVDVESSDGGHSVFQVDISGDSTLIKSKAPPREVGKNFLMIGADMWAYLPNIRRAVRVALSQKLTGQAANGDISRMRWKEDYKASIESEDESSWQLLLKSKGTGTTYDGIRVWVAKNSYRPIRGEFLTGAGRPLKRIKYEDYRDIGGGVRPTTMRIENADNSNDFSILRIQLMQPKDFPASYFTQSALQ